MNHDDRRAHWEQVYEEKDATEVGWFEAKPELSLELIAACGLNKTAPILDAGSGASRLIDALLAEGYENLIAADISERALGKTKERLGAELNNRVTWIVDDLTRSERIVKLKDVALWHDRAVLHFLTAEADREAYRETLDRVLRPGGFVILAAFALNGAPKCSGLEVRRYDVQGLKDFLGANYELLESREYAHTTPRDEARPYVYARFRRS